MPATAATDAGFDSEVLKSDIPVLVDFWAEWCGPCRQIASALDEIGNEFGNRVKIVKIDVDENPNSAASLGVRGLPALFIFKNGDVASTKSGASTAADLRNWIVETIAPADAGVA